MSDGSRLTSFDLLFSPIESAAEQSTAETVSNLGVVEKNTILRVIEKHHGKISKAAKELGLTRTAYTEDLINMTFRDLKWRILLKVILVFITLIVGCMAACTRLLLCLFCHHTSTCDLPGYDLYNFQHKVVDELDQFLESIQYRDFSRHFDKHAPSELQSLVQRLQPDQQHIQSDQ